MTAEQYLFCQGKPPTENDLWNDILKMSSDCPITRNFVREVEYGQMTKEIAVMALAKALIIDRKLLLDEVVRLHKRMPLPPIVVAVDQKNFDKLNETFNRPAA
jgi:hypothetical protein